MRVRPSCVCVCVCVCLGVCACGCVRARLRARVCLGALFSVEAIERGSLSAS